jgi:KDO2-lipid IV(A) lauroyltransferase
VTRPSHVVEYTLFSLFTGVLGLLPFRTVQKTGRLLGRLFFRLQPGRRAITIDNLRQAFPEKGDGEIEAIARGVFVNFGIAMCEFLSFERLDRAALRALVNYEANPRPFVEIGNGGKLVFITGHFGNWELAGVGSAALADVPFMVIVRTQSNGLVDRVVNRQRCAFGNRVVPMDHAVRESLTTLQSGGIVALAGDQSATRESEYVPFFGRKVATFRGPAAFALRAGAPIKMAFMVRREDGTYDFVVESVPMEDLRGASEENIRELTRRHTAVLERHVRRHPDQWLWMHRRWKHLAPEPPEAQAGQAGQAGIEEGGASGGS